MDLKSAALLKFWAIFMSVMFAVAIGVGIVFWGVKYRELQDRLDQSRLDEKEAERFKKVFIERGFISQWEIANLQAEIAELGTKIAELQNSL